MTDYSGSRWTDKWEAELVRNFEAEFGASVAVEHAMDGTRDRLERLVESGNPPEVYHDTLAGVADFVAAGRTTPVDGLVADLVTANGRLLKPRSIRAGGHARIVPHGLTLGGVLNYRVDVYDDLGLSVPTTWDDLLANARAIDESEAFDGRGFAVPAAGTAKSGLDFTNWLYTAGGDYWRWRDEAARELEVDFRTEHVRAALEVMGELSRYAPDPAQYDDTSTLRDWIVGRVGQCLMNNAWLCGVAYRGGARDVALNTRQAPVPVIERSLDPIDRGWVATNGTPVFAGANTEAAESFLRYTYEGPERQAGMNAVAPMRWLPPYDDVMDADAYRAADIFGVEDGHFLELNRRCVDEIAPHLGGDRPRNAASLYASRFPVADELVRAVIADGVAVEPEIDRARGRLRRRLREGRMLGN